MKKIKLFFIMAVIFSAQIVTASLSMAASNVYTSATPYNMESVLFDTGFDNITEDEFCARVEAPSPVFVERIEPNRIDLPSREIGSSL